MNLPGVTVDIDEYRLPKPLRSRKARHLRAVDTLLKLARSLGLEDISLTPEELARSLMVVANPKSSDVSRAAACALLDLYLADWRDVVLTDRNLGLSLTGRTIEVTRWSKAVRKRDGFKCVECGATKKLHAHHILSFARFPELRVDIDNGVTLCETCHLDAHDGWWGNV